MGTGQTKKINSAEQPSCSFWSAGHRSGTAWELSFGFIHRIRVYNAQYVYPSSSGRILARSLRAHSLCRVQKALGQAWKSILVTKHREIEVLQFLLPPCPKPGHPWGQNFAHKTDVILGFPASITRDETSWEFGFGQCHAGEWKAGGLTGEGSLCCCKSPKAPDGNKKMEINRKEQF